MSVKTNSVNWFEIPVNNLTRATKFYEGVFGVSLAPQEMGPFKMAFFPMERGAAGAPGSLTHGDGYVPSHHGTTVYFGVKSIEDTLKKIVSSGGKKLMDKLSIGEHGFIAHFEDTEGNRVSLHEMAK